VRDTEVRSEKKREEEREGRRKEKEREGEKASKSLAYGPLWGSFKIQTVIPINSKAILHSWLSFFQKNPRILKLILVIFLQLF
jgi:hypothetical protein